MAGRRLIRGHGAVAVLALALLVAACSDDGEGDGGSNVTEPTTQFGGAVLPDEVVCNVYFRAQEGTLVGYEEAEVRVPRGDGVLGGGLVEQPIGTMRFAASYLGDVPDGRGVHVLVFGADGDPIVRALYQVGDELPAPTYAGGHGFTGLHYVYDGDAELQFRCDAE